MKSLSLSQPHVIIMVGLPGSGKSFFAEKFAETFNAPYISHERITTITNASFEQARECIYYQLEELLKTKQSIIIDGCSDTRVERSELAKRARKHGYKPLIVWVQTDPTTAKNRQSKAKKILSEEEHERRIRRFTAPNAIESPVVISGKHTYASQTKVVLKKLSAPRAAISTHPTPPIERLAKPDRRNITVR